MFVLFLITASCAPPPGIASEHNTTAAVTAIASCIASQHPLTAASAQRANAAAARHTSAGALLPAPPTLSFAAAERRLWQDGAGAPRPTVNVYATLGQELELAGQRGLRLDVGQSERRAAELGAALSRNRLEADVAESLFALLAARQRTTLAEQLAPLGRRLGELAAAKLEQSLLSRLDAALLAAEANRMLLAASETMLLKDRAEREVDAWAAPAILSTIDLDMPALPAPLPQQWLSDALRDHPELRLTEEEAQAAAARAALLARERAPNVTLQAFVQSDGFGERVLGAGLSLPLFLPEPLASSRHGELATRRAEAEIAALTAAQRRTLVEATLRSAYATTTVREEQAALLARGDTGSVRAQVAAVIDALAGNQLPVREGLFAARALIELLEREADARAAVFVARTALARISGRPLREVLP